MFSYVQSRYLDFFYTEYDNCMYMGSFCCLCFAGLVACQVSISDSLWEFFLSFLLLWFRCYCCQIEIYTLFFFSLIYLPVVFDLFQFSPHLDYHT